MKSGQAESDSKDLQRMGYVQELLRDMGGFSNFAVSFSVISILTGAIQLYGYGLAHGGPAQMLFGWLLVSFFTTMVALSMAELASSYPTSGALYHWSSFLGGRTWGWFTACFNTIGQFAILAGIDYGLAMLMIGVGGWPSSPLLLNSLYIALLLSHAILNHLGIRVVAKLNDFSAIYHIVVVLVLIVALVSHGLVQPVSFLTTFHGDPAYSKSYNFLIGLLLAQWTMTGYDASAHVSEETVNPRRNAPWGVFNAVVVSVIFGLLMLVVLTLSIPNLETEIGFGDAAFSELLKARLGPTYGNTISWLVLGAMWLCGLSSLTSASRMVYAFARDGGLPYSRFFAKVSPRFRTPAVAIWGLAILSGVLAFSVKAESAVTSVAVIALYLSYGMPIAARLYVRAKGKPDERGPWDLGSFSNPVAVTGLVWICFVSVIFVIPPNEIAGKVLAVFFAIVLVIWFARAKGHFKGPKYHPR